MSIAPHPGLPVVRGDFFTDDGDRYVLVMNWVDGTDLQQVLEEQGDPGLPAPGGHRRPRPGRRRARPPARARTADHPRRREARQPRPHPEGPVVLVDFDIAGAHAGEGRVGTIGYVAPEVAAGEKPTPAADVFGLAATAVTLLSGAAADRRGADLSRHRPRPTRASCARVLRAGLVVDPARRQRSATRLVENLRDRRRAEHRRA